MGNTSQNLSWFCILTINLSILCDWMGGSDQLDWGRLAAGSAASVLMTPPMPPQGWSDDRQHIWLSACDKPATLEPFQKEKLRANLKKLQRISNESYAVP